MSIEDVAWQRRQRRLASAASTARANDAGAAWLRCLQQRQALIEAEREQRQALIEAEEAAEAAEAKEARPNKRARKR